jgi:hypothetical protein
MNQAVRECFSRTETFHFERQNFYVQLLLGFVVMMSPRQEKKTLGRRRRKKTSTGQLNFNERVDSMSSFVWSQNHSKEIFGFSGKILIQRNGTKHSPNKAPTTRRRYKYFLVWFYWPTISFNIYIWWKWRQSQQGFVLKRTYPSREYFKTFCKFVDPSSHQTFDGEKNQPKASVENTAQGLNAQGDTQVTSSLYLLFTHLEFSFYIDDSDEDNAPSIEFPSSSKFSVAIIFNNHPLLERKPLIATPQSSPDPKSSLPQTHKHLKGSKENERVNLLDQDFIGLSPL